VVDRLGVESLKTLIDEYAYSMEANGFHHRKTEAWREAIHANLDALVTPSLANTAMEPKTDGLNPPDLEDF
jgi:hypothetical protein